MTRRSSLRAQAQEIYREMAAAQAGEAGPLPNPPPQAGEGTGYSGGGECAAQGQGAATNLTARVRTLYEDSAVPVREIARLAGVTERTIYKYAHKAHWKPRYRWRLRGAAAADRGQGWRAAQGFAPAKGAGGRFIGRADREKPFAVGLKATDPAAAARAAADCRRAEQLARAAQAEADAEARAEQRLRAIAAVNRAAGKLADYLAARSKDKAARPAPDDALAHALRQSLDAATDWWQSLQAEREGE